MLMKIKKNICIYIDLKFFNSNKPYILNVSLSHLFYWLCYCIVQQWLKIVECFPVVFEIVAK